MSILGDGSVFIDSNDTGIDFAGNAFGYYLDSTSDNPFWMGGVWYSDTSLNADGVDHMAAYKGKGIDTVQILPFSPGLWDTDEYVLAFEDLHSMHWGNGNGMNDGYPEWSDTEPDFTDLVVFIGNVMPLSGPKITQHTPSEEQTDPVALITFTFNQEINEATLTSDDIHITGPSGDIKIISGPILISGTTYQIEIEEQRTPGTYDIYIGPDIENQFILLMDQDQDGIFGEEAEDRYEGSFKIIYIAGPQVLSHSPEGSVKPPVNSIDIFFNEAINPVSFDSDDVSIIGPGGGIPTNSIDQMDANIFTISFPEQRLAGDYQLIIGPQITDLFDNPMDQDGDRINGEGEVDQYKADFTILEGLHITGHSPSGDQIDPVNSLTVSFSQEIRESTFTSADILVAGPSGNIPLTSEPAWIEGTSYCIGFPEQNTMGAYYIQIGPDIESLDGLSMDQDKDGILGEEIEDRYDASFTIIDRDGPRVASHSPSGNIRPPVDQMDITFNESMDPASFDLDDISITGPSFDGNSRLINPDLVYLLTDTNDKTFRMEFTSQDIKGIYQVTIGPDIWDLAGNQMDQDEDGKNGEAQDDQCTLEFTIDITGPTIISTSVTGTQNIVIQSIDISLNEPVDPNSLSPEDVNVAGPEGSIDAISISPVSREILKITLSPSYIDGSYYVSIDPVIRDTAENTLDQDEDGNQGESTDDLYEFEFIQELPDLVIRSISLQGPEGRPNSQFDVTWTVRNNGLGLAEGEWTDTIYLSNDNVLDANDIVTKQAHFNQSLDPNQSYTRTVPITLPDVKDVHRWIVVKANSEGVLGEHGTLANNTRVTPAPLWITERPYPDLQVTEVICHESQLDSGKKATLTWTVINDGTGATSTAQWNDSIYLSVDPNWDAGDTKILSFRNVDFLAPGESYTQTQDIIVPRSAPQGDYYILVKVDDNDTVEEFDLENNNVGKTFSPLVLIVPQPYPAFLSVTSIKVPPSVEPGSRPTITWTVTNTGGETISSGWFHGQGWDDGYALSRDDRYDTSDLGLGSHTYFRDVPLEPGESYTLKSPISLPYWPSGTYYFIIIPDTHMGAGSGFGQSIIAREPGIVPITFTHKDPPDLNILSANLPDNGISGQEIRASWSVENLGGERTPSSWNDEIYLSGDEVLDGDDQLLGYLPHNGTLDFENKYDVTGALFFLPRGVTGDYYLILKIDSDDAVYEINDDNNLYTQPITISLIESDLRIPYASLYPEGETEGIAGQPITIQWTVMNAGPNTTAADKWIDKVYLSQDEYLDTNTDTYLGGVHNFNALDLNGTYSKTKDFALPGKIEGTYYLFVITDADDQLYEYEAEENNTYRIQDTLEIQDLAPDLDAIDFSAPQTGIAGQPIQVDWTVTNSGTASASITWDDAIYLSGDPNFDADTDTRLHPLLLYTGILAIGESYSPLTQAEVRLPGFIEGEHYLFFVADAENMIYEKGSKGNNISDSWSIYIQDIAPDLEVGDFNVPEIGVTGQNILLDWIVINSGETSALPGWKDAIYLSEDEFLDTNVDMKLLPMFEHTTPLNIGETDVQVAEEVRLPRDLEGEYYLFLVTDSNKEVYEKGSKGNNISPSRAITIIVIAADLAVENFTAPDTGISGQGIQVDWSVTNSGSIEAPPSWYDAIYMSDTNVFNLETAIPLGSFEHTESLGIDENYGPPSLQELIIPDLLDHREGLYYLFFYIDSEDNVYEKGTEENNICGPHPISLTETTPDLQVRDANASAQGISNEVISVDWTIVNKGEKQAPVWKDAVYLSEDPLFDPNDDRLCSIFEHTQALDPNQTTGPPNSPAFIRIPDRISGDYYIFVITDHEDSVYEKPFGEGNNIYPIPLPIEISLHPADLQVSEVNAPITAKAGSVITISWIVENRGERDTDEDYWNDGIYLSEDNDFTPASDIELGIVSHKGSLLEGESYSVSESFTLRSDLNGTSYYVYVITDVRHQVYEFDKEVNNTASNPGKIQITGIYADLQIIDLIAPSAAIQGDSIEITWIVTNAGSDTTPGSSWEDTLYLSKTGALDATAIELNTSRHQGALGSGAQYSRTATVIIPNTWTGNYYITIKTDTSPFNDIFEHEAEGNNTDSKPLYVNLSPVPDLIVTDIILPDTAAWSGQGLTTEWTGLNDGTVSTSTINGFWADSIYLSRDPYLDAKTDIAFGSINYEVEYEDELLPGETYTKNLSRRLLDFISGPYYIIAFTDSGVPDHVFERDRESNNISVSEDTLLINLTPPADLVVSSILPSESGIYGEPAQWAYEVSNQGDLPARGSWYDTLYISNDLLWDIDDLRIARVYHTGDVDPSESYTENFDAEVPPVIPGNYLIIARTDILDDVRETDNLNNSGVSVNRITVQGRELTLDQPETGTISQGQSAYYQITTEQGKDITISLMGDAKDCTELYIGFERIPTRSSYDIKGRLNSLGNLEARLFGTNSGTYYILIYGYNCPDPAPAYQILATIPGHSIAGLSIYEGGNTGRVTIGVTGYNFSPEAIAYLTPKNQTLSESGADGSDTLDQIRGTIFYEDEGSLFVAFDLEGQDPGDYIIELENPDHSVASSPFNVVEGSGGDLYARLIMPDLVRPGRPYTFTLEYGNMGDADISAPLFTISAEEEVQMRLNPSEEFHNNPISVLGIAGNNPVDILPPGLLYTVEMEFKLTADTGNVRAYLSTLEDFADPIEWETIDIRPQGMAADEWDALLARLKAQIGQTWGDYIVMLRENAGYLGKLGDHIHDVRELLAFEVLKAAVPGDPKTLAENEDALCPAPGLPISFNRFFRNGINYRNRLSTLGRGWTHSYDVSLKELADGGIIINGQDGFDRAFEHKNGTYEAGKGDYGILSKQSDGSFMLVEKDGSVYTFGTNKRLSSIKDRNSNSITFYYNEMGQLSRISHSNGFSFSLTYNTKGCIVSLTDHAGRITKYHYDNTGEHLLNVEDISGLVTSYTYNTSIDILKRNSLTSITNPDGTGVLYTYDSLGRLKTKTASDGAQLAIYDYGPGGTVIISDELGLISKTCNDRNGFPMKIQSGTGAITTQIFDPTFGLTRKIDPLNGVTFYDYDLYGNLILVIDPLGNSRHITYNGLNLITTNTDKNSSTTNYGYDPFGNLIKVTDALGNETLYTYDEYGNRTSTTDALGNKTLYEYDAMGNVTKIIDPKGAEIVFAYDSIGNLISIKDAKGNSTQYQYNNLDRITKIIDPLGNEAVFSYDMKGNILIWEDAKGAVTTYEYDIHGNLEREIDPNGFITSYGYDIRRNRTSVSNAKGNTIYYEYDLDNRLIKITDPINSITSFSYDKNGNLVSITDAENHKTNFTYDRSNRRISMADPMNEKKTYSYDNTGNLTQTTLPNGEAILYRYDSLDQLTTMVLQNGEITSYTYDSAGNIASITNPYSSLSFEYDENNRLTRVTTDPTAYQPETTISYTYDENGNLETMTDPFGGITRYAYDKFDNLTTLTCTNGNDISFSYDENSMRTSKLLPNNLKTEYGYNKNGDLTFITNKMEPETLISTYAYKYDQIGNRSSMTDLSGDHTYTYDKLNQLENAEHPTISTETFTYDKVGNRLTYRGSSQWDYNAANRLLDDGTFSYQYINGCLTQKIEKTTSKITHYSYNSLNQLIRITTDDASISYYYDGLGRRICKEINGVKTFYIYDGEDILLILDDNRDIVSRITHGPGIDEPLQLEQGGATYYYISDGLGSITQIVDSSGNVEQEYTYDSFGNIINQSGDLDNPYTYTGREYDSESGLYYYRARYYDARVGKFLTPDPIGFAGRDVNLYRYVRNNPINLIDPWGLCLDSLIEKGIYLISNYLPESLKNIYDKIKNIKEKIDMAKRWKKFLDVLKKFHEAPLFGDESSHPYGKSELSEAVEEIGETLPLEDIPKTDKIPYIKDARRAFKDVIKNLPKIMYPERGLHGTETMREVMEEIDTLGHTNREKE